MKYVLLIVALIAVGFIGYALFDKEGVVQDTVPTSLVEDGKNENETEDKNDDGVTMQTIPVSTNTSQVKVFTMSEVATHSSETSCYSVVNGSVYDLTTWIDKHPGGERAIKSICGKDGTDGFNGKHGGKPQPESMLATFKIGVLAN